MYLLDADVFISAKNLHYGFDIVPGFWTWLFDANSAGTVFSVQKVAEELKAGGDELADWARSCPATFFLSPDDAVVGTLQTVASWATTSPGSRYSAAARSDFLDSGDYHLIAHALATGSVVVTHETSSPDSTKRIKIPDACAALGIRCVTPFEMLRTEGARLVLG